MWISFPGGDVGGLAQLSREAFLADQDALDVACYRLLVAIEAALALCYHVSGDLRAFAGAMARLL